MNKIIDGWATGARELDKNVQSANVIPQGHVPVEVGHTANQADRIEAAMADKARAVDLGKLAAAAQRQPQSPPLP